MLTIHIVILSVSIPIIVFWIFTLGFLIIREIVRLCTGIPETQEPTGIPETQEPTGIPKTQESTGIPKTQESTCASDDDVDCYYDALDNILTKPVNLDFPTFPKPVTTGCIAMKTFRGLQAVNGDIPATFKPSHPSNEEIPATFKASRPSNEEIPTTFKASRPSNEEIPATFKASRLSNEER